MNIGDVITTAETDAESLWAELRSALVNFDQTLMRIIETRAWEPLGYDTFAQAWADRMRGVRLGTASMAAQVVYVLIDSGMGREEALATLGPASGVGPARFDVLARQHATGVPAQIASDRAPARTGTIVRSHFRAPASEPRYVSVELTPTEYAHFKAVADGRGLDLADEAAKAVRQWFARLERRGA